MSDHVVIPFGILACKCSNSRVDKNEELLDGWKNDSLENTMWSVMGKQTAQARKVYR